MENEEIFEAAATIAEETEKIEDTTPLETPEITVPIKFNKEIKEIPLSEASALAQKGMKFDLISEEYKTLKNLSQKNNKSIKEFLEDLKLENYNKRAKELCEKCGGDEALAQHILNLENNGETENINGFDELKSYFKNIKKVEDLPDAVIDAARLKGSLLLDEYLRYLLIQKREKENAVNISRFSKDASIGSQLNRKSNITPEASEFLKGLWR